jgi:hypothetical protein
VESSVTHNFHWEQSIFKDPHPVLQTTVAASFPSRDSAWSFGFRVWGLGFGVEGSGFRVEG